MIAALLSIVIFLVCLGLILSEKLNRTIVGIVGASVMIGLGKLIGFYSEEAAIAAVDFNTLGLLLGMMILVALLEPTGFFEYLAVWASRLSQGRPLWLLVLLGLVTTVLSMFLDNVTTVVLIAPVTILISEVLGISSTPLLITEALLSNAGGVATLVGDPPNILIASAAGLSFNDFLTHALPIVAVIWLISVLLLCYLFRSDLVVSPSNVETVLHLNPAQALKDRKTAWRTLTMLGMAILVFFLEDLLNLSPAFIALSAAGAALVWVRPDVHQMLQRIEWSVLLFFTALFMMVGGLEAAGVLSRLASLLAEAKGMPPILFGIALLWVVALLSAVVDNVPITIALIPVIKELGGAGVDIRPLWWALAFGAGFGGNGTIIGATANIVVVSLSERTRTPITAALWSRRGLPIMLATCIVASLLYALAYPLLVR